MVRWGTIALMTLATGLSGCGDGPAGSPSAGGAEFRLERFCEVEGLKPSLRHTYILIDETVLKHAQSPQEFVAANSALRDAVLAFADPERATASGASDFRERISIFLLPASGGGGERLFTGCLPALSPQESAAAREKESAVGAFLTGGSSQALTDDIATFRSRVISALVIAAGKAAAEAAPIRGPLGDTSLFRSLRASGRLIAADEGVRRVVLLSDLERIDLGGADSRSAARQAGFNQGFAVGFDFGRAEMVVLQAGASKELVREFADAFFLAQHADLTYFGDNLTASASPAPVRVERYSGQARYPGAMETVQIRIATDRDGRLSNSWVVLRGQPDRSTPLTGQAVCEAGGLCEIRSDDGGFAQAWSLEPGGEPEFGNDMPFGGLRAWSLETDPEKLAGRIYDPVVDQVGPNGDSIPLIGTAQSSATF